MKTYLVSWEIEVDADDPKQAAQRALAIQKDPSSLATVFKVERRRWAQTLYVDLEEKEECGLCHDNGTACSCGDTDHVPCQGGHVVAPCYNCQPSEER